MKGSCVANPFCWKTRVYKLTTPAVTYPLIMLEQGKGKEDKAQGKGKRFILRRGMPKRMTLEGVTRGTYRKEMMVYRISGISGLKRVYLNIT
jgi:hypothetical protein